MWWVNGDEIKSFEANLASFLGVKNVITCANGTDALQLVYMALLKRGDEIIVPSFTFVSTAEAAKLLGLKIVFADVDYMTFNIDPEKLPISKRTKAIVAVHHFGQQADTTKLLEICNKKGIILIEDNAQSLGSKQSNGKVLTGLVGTTSFFPMKVLGCWGDGGAVYTNDKKLALKIRMLANHGQRERYNYELVGINSRLDTLQSIVLSEKLKSLPEKIQANINRAHSLSVKHGFELPYARHPHTYSYFTVRVKNRDRFLETFSHPYRIYYPLPLHKQKAYKTNVKLPVSEKLCREVLTLL